VQQGQGSSRVGSLDASRSREGFSLPAPLSQAKSSCGFVDPKYVQQCHCLLHVIKQEAASIGGRRQGSKGCLADDDCYPNDGDGDLQANGIRAISPGCGHNDPGLETQGFSPNILRIA
jgi:hypothetical protein